jgi:hypothetical protein
MNNSKNFTIDYEKKAITITKKFQKEASDITSPAYHTMRQLMSDFPNFEVKCKEIKKKNGKKTYKGLKVSEMNRFLVDHFGEDSDEVKNLAKIETLAKCRNGSYATIKKWFLDNYKALYDDELAKFNTENNNSIESTNISNAA